VPTEPGPPQAAPGRLPFSSTLSRPRAHRLRGLQSKTAHGADTCEHAVDAQSRQLPNGDGVAYDIAGLLPLPGSAAVPQPVSTQAFA
jgi:hypothetical protein